MNLSKECDPPVFDGKGRLSCVEITRSRVDEAKLTALLARTWFENSEWVGIWVVQFAWRCRLRWP